MAIEEVRMRLRRKLEDSFGVEEAALLMDRPPDGWSDLVTLPVFTARFDALEYRFDAIDHRFEAIDQRFQAVDERFRGVQHQLDGMHHRFDAIDANLSSLKFEILSDIDQRFRAQTWALVTTLFAMFAVLLTAMGVMLAVAA
jgi:hypothetical protein